MCREVFLKGPLTGHAAWSERTALTLDSRQVRVDGPATGRVILPRSGLPLSRELSTVDCLYD
jgi:hypothetical protein